MTKAQVIDLLNSLPEKFELEDLFEQLLFVQRLEDAIKQSDAGQTVSEAEARAYLSRWTAASAAANSTY